MKNKRYQGKSLGMKMAKYTMHPKIKREDKTRIFIPFLLTAATETMLKRNKPRS
jgi:hypothetical protein